LKLRAFSVLYERFFAAGVLNFSSLQTAEEEYLITVQSELVAQFRNSTFYLTQGELLPHFRYSPFYHSQCWWLSSATQPSTSHQVSSCHISATHLSITVSAGGSVPQLNLLPHTRRALATFPLLTFLSQSSQSRWLSSATHPYTSHKVS
jgi:hypothetical protein